jgi:hypothetical protein
LILTVLVLRFRILHKSGRHVGTLW